MARFVELEQTWSAHIAGRQESFTQPIHINPRHVVFVQPARYATGESDLAETVVGLRDDVTIRVTQPCDEVVRLLRGDIKRIQEA